MYKNQWSCIFKYFSKNNWVFRTSHRRFLRFRVYSYHDIFHIMLETTFDQWRNFTREWWMSREVWGSFKGHIKCWFICHTFMRSVTYPWCSLYYCVLVFCPHLHLLHYSSHSFLSHKVSLPVTDSTEDSLLRNHYSFNCKCIPASYGTQRFIGVFTKAHQSDQSSPHHNIIYFRSILMLSSHLHLCLPRGAFPSCWQTTFL
jgi:hypothetical protein